MAATSKPHAPKLIQRMVPGTGFVGVLTRRNRYLVKYYFPDGSNITWMSEKTVHIAPEALVKQLREIADTLEHSLARKQHG